MSRRSVRRVHVGGGAVSLPSDAAALVSDAEREWGCVAALEGGLITPSPPVLSPLAPLTLVAARGRLS